MGEVIFRLAPYPSTTIRKGLSPSQLSVLNQKISTGLHHAVTLPPGKGDNPSSLEFVRTYAKDTAVQTLHTLVWDSESKSSEGDKLNRTRTLALTKLLAASSPGLSIQTLLDIAIIYAPSHRSKTRALFLSALELDPQLPDAFAAELVPALTSLLTQSPAAGLYSLRKTTHCIACLTRVIPPELLRAFAHSKPFILAMAQTYDQTLTVIAQSYGGLRYSSTRMEPLDDWERLWMDSKVSIMDTFHLLFGTLLKDISQASGRTLATESERTFDTIFALLHVSSPSHGAESTPFLNSPLLVDYQQSYDLSRLLSSALKHAAEKDARLDLLESALDALGNNESSSASTLRGRKNPGALTLLIRSSGIPPGMHNRGAASINPDKGKGKANDPLGVEAVDESGIDFDLLTSQILDILPDADARTIRILLRRHNGDMEKVIQALLEGTAVDIEAQEMPESHVNDVKHFVQQRRNVFDDDRMDLSQVRIGKKAQDESTILRDRAAIAQMKADILRRAEELSNDEEEEEFTGNDPVSGPVHMGAKGKGKQKNVEPDIDEEGEGVQVKIGGDGEDSEDERSEEEDEVSTKPAHQGPEQILEQAYISDPKQFERDAQTRRSKARIDLKSRTGWDDSQIEGWRIMLERNPKKAKILEQHEFAGNHIWAPGDGPAPPRGNSSKGRGGTRGRGRGARGGAKDGNTGGAPGSSAREKAWNDKNKASQGNHNRKRGHDKKMARGGGVPMP